ncbi:MAG: cbb3-type cytochrome c oxidase subunit I [Flavobacteriales bacterium]|nr:cbb3-type cytochrome c oxidase subunit I [Flavobacteriales bacterium]MCX7650753.1 cbb3-type cytochrome c oxidase subunit I [Flavobacteriales bacterium]MDW8433047.1 cbb3-type cytochrome c oxidase subunit I [Flavobacteriales bacterium]
MATTITTPTDVLEHSAHAASAHHHREPFITKYIFSQDHKMIAKQFLVTSIFWAFVALIMSIIFRLQLAWPGQGFVITEMLMGKWGPDGVLDPNAYLSLVTMHGTIMVFFVLTAGLTGTYANLLIPLQLGVRDMVNPFMNMLSYWFFFASSVVMFISLFVESGPAAAGWTIYPPLSALPEAIPGSGLGMTLWLVSMALFIISSLLGGLNYVATVINCRTKGMKMTRMPLTIWCFMTAAILGILSFPVLFAAALLLIFDRSFGTAFFLSDIYINGMALEHTGGSPVLFQHLFWFLGHPEVYIVLLPALGIASEIISTMSRKPIFGYRAMVASMFAIAGLSFIVWGHHMFVTGMDPFLGSVFTFTTLLIAIPSAIKAFNYITTLWKGNIVLSPGMLFAIGIVSLFISGGLTGIILGDSALDITVHHTYFVTAHFHLVMGIATLFGIIAGVYHWFPKLYGRMMNNQLGYVHFWITMVCAYAVFWPMHYLGLAGVPRRYYSNTAFPMFDNLQDLNVIITVAAIIGGLAQLIFLYNFIYSIFWGPKAPQNPWRGTTLEWTAPVEHIHGNWPGEIPEVHRWPYDYSIEGEKEDFIPQNVPLREHELKEAAKHH